MEAYNNKTIANRKDWHVNTALGCNVKTILKGDRIMRSGKDYQGVLRRDVECDEFRYDEHYTFVETVHARRRKNPHVYVGKYVTLTRRDDGSLRPNFKPMPKLGLNMSVDNYAFEVYRELHEALTGLVEEG